MCVFSLKLHIFFCFATKIGDILSYVNMFMDSVDYIYSKPKVNKWYLAWRFRVHIYGMAFSPENMAGISLLKKDMELMSCR